MILIVAQTRLRLRDGASLSWFVSLRPNPASEPHSILVVSEQSTDGFGVLPMADAPTSSPANPVHLKYQTKTLNAVSFGFVATAVLFAMFVVMAIFERVLRPHRSSLSQASGEEEQTHPQLSSSDKPELRQMDSYSRVVPVLMPGHDYPTHFARPIPSPLAADRVEWPSHAECSQQNPSRKHVTHTCDKVRTFTGNTEQKEGHPVNTDLAAV